MKVAQLLLSLLLATNNALTLLTSAEEGIVRSKKPRVPSSSSRELQQESLPYTPSEVQDFFDILVMVKYRGNKMRLLKDADEDNDGILNGTEINTMFTVATVLATGDRPQDVDAHGGRRHLLVPVALYPWIITAPIWLPYVPVVVSRIIDWWYSSGANRDPHYMTFGGRHGSFSAICDVVLMKHPHFAEGAGLEIQGRSDPVTRNDDSSDGAVFSVVAVRLGPDVLEVWNDGTYYLNKMPDAPLPYDVASGFTIIKKLGEVCYGPDFGERCAPSVNFEITTEVTDYMDILDRQHITIKAHRGFVDVGVELSSDYLDGTSGVMGTFPSIDGNSHDQWSRDGSKVFADQAQGNDFAQNWQVNPAEGDTLLFQNLRAPQYPDQCIFPDDNANAGLRRRI